MSLPQPPPPPPPLLPPPPPPIRPDSGDCFVEAGGVVMEDVDVTHYMYVGQMALQQYRHQHQTEGEEKNSDLIFLSHYKAVVPIIQKGPLCGLVAVAMAAPLLQESVTTETLLDMAIASGYTKQGEMFSAATMSSVVQEAIGDRVRGEVVPDWQESQVLTWLLQGDLLLVPYDADKNHSPCLKRGHKAHWMLLTGCFLAVDNTTNMIDVAQQLEDKEDYYERKLYHLKPGDTSTTPDVLRCLRQHPHMIRGALVYGHQGKSRHTGVWTIQELMASNAQLVELGSDRDTENYVVPTGGVEQGLCRQIVRVFPSEAECT